METKLGLASDGSFGCLPSTLIPASLCSGRVGTHRGIFRTGGNLKVIERIPFDVQDIPSVPTDLGVVRVQLSRLQNSVTGRYQETVAASQEGGRMDLSTSLSQSVSQSVVSHH